MENEKRGKSMEECFDNSISEMEMLGEKDLAKKISSIKEDVFRIKDTFNDETEKMWEEVDSRLKEITEEFSKHSASNDMKLISFCFGHARKTAIFDKKLMEILNVKEHDPWTPDDIRNAILIVLRSYRKEIKATKDIVLLSRFDLLKENIKKSITGKSSDFKNTLFLQVLDELESDAWEKNESIQFLIKALYLHNRLKLYEMSKELMKFFKNTFSE